MSSPKSILISAAFANIVISKARETKQVGHYVASAQVQGKTVSVQLWLLSKNKARAYSPSGKQALKQALLEVVWSASVEGSDPVVEQPSPQESKSSSIPVSPVPARGPPALQQPKQVNINVSCKNTNVQVRVKVNKEEEGFESAEEE